MRTHAPYLCHSSSLRCTCLCRLGKARYELEQEAHRYPERRHDREHHEGQLPTPDETNREARHEHAEELNPSGQLTAKTEQIIGRQSGGRGEALGMRGAIGCTIDVVDRIVWVLPTQGVNGAGKRPVNLKRGREDRDYVASISFAVRRKTPIFLRGRKTRQRVEIKIRPATASIRSGFRCGPTNVTTRRANHFTIAHAAVQLRTDPKDHTAVFPCQVVRAFKDLQGPGRRTQTGTYFHSDALPHDQRVSLDARAQLSRLRGVEPVDGQPNATAERVPEDTSWMAS